MKKYCYQTIKIGVIFPYAIFCLHDILYIASTEDIKFFADLIFLFVIFWLGSANLSANSPEINKLFITIQGFPSGLRVGKMCNPHPR